MKTYQKYILSTAVLAGAVLTGCKDKMRELNTDPNLISQTQPEAMFYGATYNWGWFWKGWMTERAGNIGSTMQINNNGAGSYVDPTTWSGGNPGYLGRFWTRYYSAGKNLNSICKYIDEQLKGTEQARYQDIRAISRLLQIHEAWTIFTNYGTMVFNDAFKVREGVTYPTYDIYSVDIYKQLDDSVKACIAQLNSPVREDAVSLGLQDNFYGSSYTVTPDVGGVKWTATKPEKQRERWLKFATTLRLKMAFSMRNVAADTYQTVLNEVRQQVAANPNSLMSEVQDGLQYVLPDASYDRNDGNQMSFWHMMSVAYINSMKQSNDPRLPLVALTNYCDTSLSVGYKFVATYFPDSLKERQVYDEKTKTWSTKSWGDVLKQGNVFQGRTFNPANNSAVFGPGTLLKNMSQSLTMHHPDWKDPNTTGISEEEKQKREEDNAKLTTIKLKNHFTGVVEEVKYNGKDAFVNGARTVSFRVVSGPQNRHYVLNSSNGTGWGTAPFDYDNNNPSSGYHMVNKVLSYAEHCFLMALICNYEGGMIGSKGAEDWYNEGIQASMQETQEDAQRVYVKIATNPNFPLIAGVNGTSNEDKHLYKIDYKGDDYTDYLTQPQVAFSGSQDEKTNKIMIQMWLALWQSPENTWFYYKATGYPHTVKYEWETSTLDAMPKTMGLEQPYLTTGQEMLFPRRLSAPTPQAENMPNWYEMQETMEAQPGYAPHGWTDYSGRVFWDVVEPAGLY
ncbi:SusD/RagB family nutrient-binding outer membrane lipoprotein [uncultured Rikenella sp.]|uniref:SusD/RagB family nutrient-binding outer membrane lipoprotein n=1 Tax=uncultured Rikenella sp. TaxID=368003 RepID=UPI002629837A|nr:SusD/RagB family nutrient-binding outer membrane lipoprotein [uncultured Rikenella sp.]